MDQYKLVESYIANPSNDIFQKIHKEYRDYFYQKAREFLDKNPSSSEFEQLLYQRSGNITQAEYDHKYSKILNAHRKKEGLAYNVTVSYQLLSVNDKITITRITDSLEKLVEFTKLYSNESVNMMVGLTRVNTEDEPSGYEIMYNMDTENYEIVFLGDDIDPKIVPYIGAKSYFVDLLYGNNPIYDRLNNIYISRRENASGQYTRLFSYEA